MPGITTIKQQGTGTVGADFFDQRRQVSEAAHLAVDTGQLLEVQICKSVGVEGVGLEVEMIQEVITDQMRNLAPHAANAEIDIGFTEIDRVQLGMAVGNVQK